MPTLQPQFAAALSVLLALLCGGGGCGRTDLDAEDLMLSEALEDATLTDAFDAGLPADDRDATVAADASDAPASPDATPAPDEPPITPCTPTEEVCNGRDDDCNGAVDDVPSVACPGGGSSYCIAGSMSACPARCETCLPGSERVCMLSYCTFWGIQTCTADGRSFGRCREHEPPPECRDIAREHRDSRELEQCCLDNGYCCLDRHDLDGDGNRSEMLGRCDEVLCEF